MTTMAAAWTGRVIAALGVATIAAAMLAANPAAASGEAGVRESRARSWHLASPPKPRISEAEDGSILVDGVRRFSDRGELLASPQFRQWGLRCGTRSPAREPADADGLRFLGSSPADCTLSQTVPDASYDASGGTLYRIPVVVHVLRRSNGTTGHVSEACVAGAIEMLNDDFRARRSTPGAPGTDTGIEFLLAETDPAGNPTSGITYSNNDSWFDEVGDYWTTLAWDPTRFVNIYTSSADGFLGFVTHFPQESGAGTASDRVVVRWSAFGPCATEAPFDGNRTLTHEVGHYLGLYHTFEEGCGSGSCNASGDLICDTAPESEPRYGCPAGAASCGTPDPIRNYMDYTDDACMWEFTSEQSRRMRCSLVHYRPGLIDDGGGGGGDSLLVEMGSHALSGGGTHELSLEGLEGSLTGFSIQFDFTGSGEAWASDLLLTVDNGTAGLEAGGFDASQRFGYEFLGDWSFYGAGSASAGTYADSKAGALSLGPGGSLRLRIRNGWGAAPAVTYSEVQVVLQGVTLPAGPACPGDFDGNGVVDGADLGTLLLQWNTSSPAHDLDGDDLVSGADLGLLLLNWGPCA